ncbi:hypothetical protein N7499_004088 [Penicillium canescens]|uniref:F-box domain-containing protein n=1 Tax=Penicillium canescens TaxID=5083 RepID=A0AAD6I9G3_PENCN|nr:hypothetical protein N7460_007700 [Penicillium canescens]KAJ6061043.1 hypothetical protein N7444_001739 [Penicillium canescens]KAJ6088837.1 hypothetical protein N7499_004088 [Penicillium canescens]KAJ6174237.1 hypothetical protein N7485_005537 [Penicillium canescens]
MLNTLPCEILMFIADWLSATTLRVLSRVSSRLYAVLVPRIYRTISFCAASEWALNVLNVEPFFLRFGPSRAADYLQHARHLQIKAPFHLVRFNRCAYYNIFRAAGLPESPATLGASDEAAAHRQFLDDVKDQLQLIFTHLKPNRLSTFEWRLGTRVPVEVLDQEGYLSRYQQRLARLSLVTDGTCPETLHRLDGVSRLSCLTAFEWERLQHPSEVDLLRQCIRRNWSRLDQLSVGFVPSAFARALCWESLGLQQSELEAGNIGTGDTRNGDTGIGNLTAPPALSTLSLSKVTLPPDILSEHHAIFCSLRALTLRDCPNQLRLVQLLSRSQKPLRLMHFEFSFDYLLHEPGEGRSLSAVVRFLCSFRGLQHLHLRLSNFPASKSHIQDAIGHHQSTLKSLVYHERQLTPIDADGLFEDDRDVSPAWITNLSAIVDLGQVSAVALCASPSAARRCLRPTAKHSKLQILHLRFSGLERIHRDIPREITTFLRESRKRYSRHPRSCWGSVNQNASNDNHSYGTIFDEYFARSQFEYMDPQQAVLASSAAIAEAEELVSFAEWAFGPDGLPALQVLAFGDFSHGDRYRNQQFLMRRVYASSGGNGLAGPAYVDTTRLPFHSADMSDSSIWDGAMVDGARFLSACPGGGLMESPYEL